MKEKTVYFENGVIMSCPRQCDLHRYIKLEQRYNGPMRYWFRPTDEWRRAEKEFFTQLEAEL